MAPVTVYVHPTCPSSRALLEGLDSRGLLGRVRVVDATLPGPTGVLWRGVWSVPWVVVDGEPAAADPVAPEEVEAMVEGRRLEPPRDPVRAFMETVMHSGYAASLVVVHGSLEPVLDRSLASAAVRAPLTGADPESVLSSVRDDMEALYEDWIDPLARVAGLAVARALYWARGRLEPEDLANISEGTVSAVLLALASIGRAGIPGRPPRESGRVASFLRRGSAGIARKITREQEALSDGWLERLAGVRRAKR